MTSHLKRIALSLAAAAIIGVAAFAPSGATAGTVGGDNAFTWGEFMNIGPGQAKGNVESQYGCACHGTTIRHWDGRDGHRRFQVEYPDGDANSVFITYRYDGFGYPRTVARMFATDGEGYNVPW